MFTTDLQHQMAGQGVQSPGPGKVRTPQHQMLDHQMSTEVGWTHCPHGGQQDPKMLLYGQLKQGLRNRGRPLKRYKDSLKANLKSCNIAVNSWEETAQDRTLWSSVL